MHSNYLDLPPELFRPILLFLSKKDLISAALVCKGWSEEASDVIWGMPGSEVPSKALLSVLGPLVRSRENHELHRINATLSSVSDTRKERFVRLASAVKTLRIDTPLAPESIQLVQDITGEMPLLSRLQTLKFLTAGLFLTSPLMKLLRGSSIKQAIISHVTRTGKPLFDTREVMQPAAEIWARIAQFMPQVEVIIHQGFTLIPKGFVYPHLKFLSATSPEFFLACFQSLALQPHLEELHLDVQIYQHHAWDDKDRPVVLPRITKFTLTYYGEGAESKNLLQDLKMPLLKDIDIGVPCGLEPEDIRDLSERSPLIEDLRLTTNPPLVQKHLEYLGRFKNLKLLSINAVRGFNLPSTALEGFFKGIKNVETLVLTAPPIPHELIRRPCNFLFTLSTLASIATNCKKLHTLVITLCIRPEQESVRPDCAFAKLKKLGFPSACGDKKDVLKAAKTIANMCRYSGGEIEFVGKESGLVYVPEELGGVASSLKAAIETELKRLRAGEASVTVAMAGVHL